MTSNALSKRSMIIKIIQDRKLLMDLYVTFDYIV